MEQGDDEWGRLWCQAGATGNMDLLEHYWLRGGNLAHHASRITELQ
jgi:hypothetical protein